MTSDVARIIERGIDVVAAALLAAAVGTAVAMLSAPLPLAVVGSCLAGLAGFVLLSRVSPKQQSFPLPSFALDPPAFNEVEELLLTIADRLADEPPVEGASGPELLLDDVLAEPADDSRVVGLFDRGAMPTPGELRHRIDAHLGAGAGPIGVVADDSRALHDALAELRRSLS
jgi:hypothetical protein